jgi:hypothetical protein
LWLVLVLMPVLQWLQAPQLVLPLGLPPGLPLLRPRYTR